MDRITRVEAEGVTTILAEVAWSRVVLGAAVVEATELVVPHRLV
jgi:hypothetical protein